MPQQIEVPGMGVVEFPDGMSDADISAAIQKNVPKEQPGSTATGVAKSAGVGLAQGVIGLAGLPGDLMNLGMRALGDNLTPESSFGSGAIQKVIEGYTGDFYNPQGRAEQLANTAGQFLPAVIGGPETLAVKAATRVGAPALATEAAGALTDDNPYARVAGGLTGALAGPAAFNRAVKSMRPGQVEPTIEELKAASRAGYQHPEIDAVSIKPQSVNNLAASIENDLLGQGFRAKNHPAAFDVVDELKSASGPVRIADLDATRKALGVTAKEVDAVGKSTASALAAQKAIAKIDDFLPNLGQADLIAGDAAKANAILGEARQNWGAAKRSERVQTLAANAEINAASANSGGNIQNATKQAFKPLLRNNAAKAVGYNVDELAALNNIVRGTWTGSAARAAGNLLGGGGGLGMLAGGAAGYSQGGVPGAIAVGLAGRGLKRIGDRSTLNAVAKLDKMLRARSPEAVKMAAQNPQIAQLLPPAAVKRLQIAIASDPILSGQITQPAQNNRQ